MASARPSTRRVRRPTDRPAKATDTHAQPAATASTTPAVESGRSTPPRISTPAPARSAKATSRRRREPASATPSGAMNASVTATPIGSRSIDSKNVKFEAPIEMP